jgi:AcrR family transcriptional regulator
VTRGTRRGDKTGKGRRGSQRSRSSTRPRQGPRGGRAAVERRVLTAARRLFADKGYGGVAVREIALEAGVSHALVHRYFGRKEQLLAAVLRDNEEWIATRAGEAATLQEAVVVMLRETRRERRDYFKLVARLAMDPLPEGIAPPDFPATRRLLAVAAQEAGVLQGEEGAASARALVSAMVALVIGWSATEGLLLQVTGLGEPGDLDADAALERAVLTLFEGWEGAPPARAD